MQHMVFGIPMQDVQNQKTLYKPGAPRKEEGNQEGNNFWYSRWGKGSHTREAEARGQLSSVSSSSWVWDTAPEAKAFCIENWGRIVWPWLHWPYSA